MQPLPRTLMGVERGVVSFALAWQALWLIADPRAWPVGHASIVTSLAIVASVAAWAVLLAAHLRRHTLLMSRASWIDLTALVVALVGMLAATSQTPDHDWGPATSWALLSAGLAGLLFPSRIAAGWVSAVVLLEAAFVFGVPGTNEVSAVLSDLLYPGYALTVGVITISARHVLLREASGADAAAADAAAAATEQLVAEGDRAVIRREERVLHEIVLNTLVAIVRGRTPSSPDFVAALRERSRESARVLRALQTPRGPLSAYALAGRLDLDVRDALDDLRASEVVVHVRCDPLPVPPSVYDALLTATREALSNVRRHAEAQAAWLSTTVTVSSRQTAVAIEVRDDGRGFVAHATPPRFGLRDAIAAPMSEVGGFAEVTSTRGQGTRVVLSWPAPGEGTRDQVGREVLRPTAAFTLPVLLSFGVYASAQFVAGLSQFASPALDALAFALFASLAVLLGWASLRGPFGWGVLVVVIGASPFVYELQTRGLGVVAAESWVAWSSGAIVALFFVLAAGGPRWGWVVVLATWLVIQGDVIAELLAPGTALILAAVLFGRSLRRTAASAGLNRITEARMRSAEYEARLAQGSIRARYGALQHSQAADLLESIADGRRDPDDPKVRIDAALEERFIRTVLRVDPTADAVGAMVSSLAVEARRVGVFLDVDIAGSLRISNLADVGQSLAGALACSQPGGTARLTARREGSEDVVRLVAPIGPDRRSALARLPLRGVHVDPTDPAELDMLWEIRSRADGASAVATLGEVPQ